MSLVNWLRDAFSAGPSRERVAARLQRAIALHESGKLERAAAGYQRILASDPRNAQAWHLTGVIAHQRGDHRTAIERIHRAIAENPQVALFHFNLGNAYAALEDTESGAACFRRAVELDPRHASAWFNLGGAESRLGRYASAADALRRALNLSPELPGLQFALARVLVAAAQSGQAPDDCCAEAAELIAPRWQSAPDPVDARLLLALALQEHGDWSEAASHYEAVIDQHPDHEGAHNNLANCYNQLGRMSEAIRHYREVVRISPANALAASSIVSCLNYDESIKPEHMLAEHRAWAERYAEAAPRPGSHPNARDPERRLRLGYVSPDFRRHLVATLFAPVLERHDRARFEVFCYYNYPVADALTGRIRQRADHWRDVHAISDRDLARSIAEDRIDVLVDLAGHTSFGRLLALAHKPAPVQVSWLGYFGTTGLDSVDAFITDPHSSPPGQEAWFTETLVRLPETRFVFEPHEFHPEVGPLPAAWRGYVTFGCFNNLAKLNAQVLALWARVLQLVPGSRFAIQASALNDAPNRERFLEQCERSGLSRDRVDIRPWMPFERAAASYRDIDIALDPFPFCGGMTSLDALWMGVPVVTLAGALVAGRQTTSMLVNLGLSELAAGDESGYADTAAALARDLDRLAQLRSGLRRRFAASPLCDYARFTLALEDAYRGLWRRWAAGAAPPPSPPPQAGAGE